MPGGHGGRKSVMILIKRLLVASLLLMGSLSATAVTMDITASFTPTMDNPENNAFINTTPQSGYCTGNPPRPQECLDNGVFSIATHLELTPSKGLTTEDQPRDSLFFKWPNTFREIQVTNIITSDTSKVRFRVSSFSANYRSTVSGANNWMTGNFTLRPQGGCTSAGEGWVYHSWTTWIWRLVSGEGCYNITTIERPQGSDNFIYGVDGISIGYVLETPNPLTLDAGIYKGSISFVVGPGGDIDFGDNFQANDNHLTVNFTLSVNHELKLTTAASDQKVSLQPCTTGTRCTEEQGKANWERWMITRITPQLTGRSNFRLSSSGAFTVYLQCEQQSGTDCGLKSDSDPSQVVPVQSLLTLPDNIVDANTGAVVSKRRLAVERDLTRNVFSTKNYGENKAGSIDFLVSQRDVDTMLKTRPDTYRGAVTVIFDPQIY
ncbi:hypothetical protein AV903_19935 [Erwinia tracheiphila]|uniref:Fimbrial protein n=2 Tax=Erwinia tracheiphila TaxID=65700 RepID=A0A345CWI3_9GAMM|nr:hypothetical protein AV903_19935 [Erwinia tracheiphila]